MSVDIHFECLHWALLRTLTRTEYFLFLHHATSILGKFNTWCFEDSRDISCSLLINQSHPDESWEGAKRCLWIFALNLFIEHSGEHLSKHNIFCAFITPQAFCQSSAPGALSTLVTSVVLYSLTRARMMIPGKDKTRIFGYTSEFIHWGFWRTLIRTEYFLLVHHTPSSLAKLNTWCFEHYCDINCSLLLNPSHTDELSEEQNTCLWIYDLHWLIDHSGEHWREQNIFRLFTTPQAFWQSSATGALTTQVTSVALYSLARATLITTGKGETRVCGSTSEFIHWALCRTLMRIEYFLFLHHATSILATFRTWRFKDSGDISCCLVVSPSHTDESWERRNTCLWIYALNLFIELSGEHGLEENISCSFTTPQAFWQSSAPGASCTLATAVAV